MLTQFSPCTNADICGGDLIEYSCVSSVAKVNVKNSIAHVVFLVLIHLNNGISTVLFLPAYFSDLTLLLISLICILAGGKRLGSAVLFFKPRII